MVVHSEDIDIDKKTLIPISRIMSHTWTRFGIMGRWCWGGQHVVRVIHVSAKGTSNNGGAYLCLIRVVLGKRRIGKVYVVVVVLTDGPVGRFLYT